MKWLQKQESCFQTSLLEPADWEVSTHQAPERRADGWTGGDGSRHPSAFQSEETQECTCSPAAETRWRVGQSPCESSALESITETVLRRWLVFFSDSPGLWSRQIWWCYRGATHLSSIHPSTHLSTIHPSLIHPHTHPLIHPSIILCVLLHAEYQIIILLRMWGHFG